VTVHHDLLTTNAIPVSSCLNFPGPGDKSVGRFALMSIGFPTVAAENVDCPDETSIQIPMTGAESEGSLALTVVDPSTAGGYCYCPVATDYLTTGYGQMNHKPGYLIGCFDYPDPGI